MTTRRTLREVFVFLLVLISGSAGGALAGASETHRVVVLYDERTDPQIGARLKDKGIDLPVIAISARDDEETRMAARTLGARFFLRKPLDDRALLDAIAWVTGTC